MKYITTNQDTSISTIFFFQMLLIKTNSIRLANIEKNILISCVCDLYRKYGVIDTRNPQTFPCLWHMFQSSPYEQTLKVFDVHKY